MDQTTKARIVYELSNESLLVQRLSACKALRYVFLTCFLDSSRTRAYLPLVCSVRESPRLLPPSMILMRTKITTTTFFIQNQTQAMNGPFHGERPKLEIFDFELLDRVSAEASSNTIIPSASTKSVTTSNLRSSLAVMTLYVRA